LVAGGAVSGAEATTSAELFDPNTGTWTPTGSLAKLRVGQTATLLRSGMVLVAGGTTVTGSTELYDPSQGTWSTSGGLSTPRLNHTATLLQNGMVLVAGGQVAGIETSTATAELYDPVAGTWSPTGSLAVARWNAAATLLQNGTVLVASGFYYEATTVYTSTPSAELYDPISGTWTLTGSLSVSRGSFTGTLLTNGQYLVAGGLEGPPGIEITASAELFDPSAGTWSMAASLPTPLYDQAATLLENGTVLVVGGVSSSGNSESPTASAEIYLQ
jgi:N-acetylneuraminic acid mutarotase